MPDAAKVLSIDPVEHAVDMLEAFAAVWKITTPLLKIQGNGCVVFLQKRRWPRLKFRVESD